MDAVLMTVKVDEGAPAINEVARILHIPEEAVDATFGVVLIDPVRHLYSVRVSETAIRNAGSKREKGVHGPYSDPKITPFGPPMPRRSSEGR